MTHEDESYIPADPIAAAGWIAPRVPPWVEKLTLAFVKDGRTVCHVDYKHVVYATYNWALVSYGYRDWITELNDWSNRKFALIKYNKKKGYDGKYRVTTTSRMTIPHAQAAAIISASLVYGADLKTEADIHLGARLAAQTVKHAQGASRARRPPPSVRKNISEISRKRDERQQQRKERRERAIRETLKRYLIEDAPEDPVLQLADYELFGNRPKITITE